MALRVLVNEQYDEFTGKWIPYPYNGNCFYSENSKELQTFKKEVLKEHPEFKDTLKIITVNTMEKILKKNREELERNPAYLESKAYLLNR